MNARLFPLLCAAMLAAGCDTSKPNAGGAQSSGAASTNREVTTSAAPAPDTVGGVNDTADATNTGRNKRDRDSDALTADDQSESRDDVQTTAEIRRAITKDKSLSVNAHNVKIIAKDGTVTLRGPVDNAEEKSAIVAEAHRIAGDSNVVDELEIEASGSESE